MKNHARLLGAETVGTALLMIGGPGSAVLGGLHPVATPLAFGLTLVLVTAVLGPRSGAQVNPAVTLGLLLARRLDGQQAAMAWIGQTVGAVVGGGLVLAAATSRPDFERGVFFSNGWGSVSPGGYDWPGVFIIEFVVSVVLVTAVLTVASDRHGWATRALVLGATTGLIALVSLPVTSVGANPARSFGTAVFASSDTSALGMLLPFLLIPMAGSIAGVAVWLMIDDTRLEQTGLFLAPLARTRDIADRVVGDVVETVDEVVERAGRVEDDR